MNLPNRRLTKEITLGRLKIGGGNPITIQTMTKVPTRLKNVVKRQAAQLIKAGADIIRVAVKYKEDIEGLKALCHSFRDTPFIADIHFSKELAVSAIRAGAHGIRLNPGNLPDGLLDDIVKAIKDYNPDIAIRVGVNSGSIADRYRNRGRIEAMVNSAVDYIKALEDKGLANLKVSIKSSDVIENIEANRLLAKMTNYPIHLGVTATGDTVSGIIKSSLGIGILLLEGIGDTIRVSLTAPPDKEVFVAQQLLLTLGLVSGKGPQIIACPTCGRTSNNIFELVERLQQIITDNPQRFAHVSSVAIMGCEVNGPGEASDADIGIAFGRDVALLFKKGRVIKRVPVDEVLDVLLLEMERLR